MVEQLGSLPICEVSSTCSVHVALMAYLIIVPTVSHSAIQDMHALGSYHLLWEAWVLQPAAFGFCFLCSLHSPIAMTEITWFLSIFQQHNKPGLQICLLTLLRAPPLWWDPGAERAGWPPKIHASLSQGGAVAGKQLPDKNDIPRLPCISVNLIRCPHWRNVSEKDVDHFWIEVFKNWMYSLSSFSLLSGHWMKDARINGNSPDGRAIRWKEPGSLSHCSHLTCIRLWHEYEISFCWVNPLRFGDYLL